MPEEGQEQQRPKPAAEEQAPSWLGAMENLIARLGGERETVEKLFTENHSLREERRLAKDKIVELEKLVPGDGSVLLTGDELASWNAYRELGDPAQIRESMKELFGIRRQAEIREAAKAAGVAEGPLSRLLTNETLEIKDGKSYVVDGESRTPLDEYARQNFKEFEPVLFPNSQKRPGNQPGPEPVAPRSESQQEAADASRRLARSLI